MHSRNSINNDLPENLDLNDKFQSAIDIMENTDLSVFITGPAGTGKTTLEKYFIANTKKKVIVLAPTGVAALNAAGQTVHSFFRFPPKIMQKNDIRRLFHSVLIQNLDMIIIDEVSMVRADLMDAIDYSLRVNRDEMDKPFGGVQMVFFGDLFQLSPVVKKEEMEVLRMKYPTPYVFSANVFDDFEIKYIELSKIYRQMNVEFINLLNRIRDKQHTNEDLRLLNKRVQKTSIQPADRTIVLTTTNSLASSVNQYRLAGLPGREYSYKAAITGRFDMSAYPTDTDIRLKKGAQIILIKNDISKRWVNGTLAKVVELSDTSIKVDIKGDACEVPIEKWDKIEYSYDEKEDKIKSNTIGTFEQYPIRLAWALTIHKSQGHTLDKLILDLGHGAFAHGQVYVALSRCTSLDGITLRRPVIHSDIIFDKDIYKFRDRFINML